MDNDVKKIIGSVTGLFLLIIGLISMVFGSQFAYLITGKIDSMWTDEDKYVALANGTLNTSLEKSTYTLAQTSMTTSLGWFDDVIKIVGLILSILGVVLLWNLFLGKDGILRSVQNSGSLK